ncbi:MAG: T9SS type A sorting domain-containing protein [Actinobacteria bacterium]|nr:T9SS type A sorting domain-containing protein [Actinomycetota bacterium]
MKIKSIILILFLFVGAAMSASFSVYEANYPNVKDYNVNVDTTSLKIVPRGAYVEMNLKLTVSYDFESWFFKNYNELEFQWTFSLPEQATMTGFWLMLDDTLRPATMLDKWTAELLFSEVSSPVRNPALLTQSFPDREGMVHYQLRVYPVMRDIKRTFIVQYLLPARPTNETLRAWLPTSQLTTRNFRGAEKLHISFMSEDEPTLLGAEITDHSFNNATSSWDYDIALDFDQFVELVYPSPIKGKHFFSTFEQNDETFYQLAVYPPEVEKQITPRNFLILFDYNRFNTNDMDGELVLLSLKETMQQALSAQDSANIIVAFKDLAFAADSLLPCTEANLDRMFENVLRRSFPAYSNFQMLLAAAADFINRGNSQTEIILLTNTDEIELWGKSREQFADEIISMFPMNTKIHIVDLENKSYLIYNRDLDQYETQLQSFYGYMTNKTGGNLFFLRYHSIKSILAALFYEKISHFQEVEVQTRFAGGYAYGKHLIALHRGYYPLHFPVIQVGRFRGQLPLDVTVLGKVRLEKWQDQFTINESDVVPGSEKLATAWYGDHIHNLLKQPQTNPTIMEIMDLSMKHNIMTPYTGYLVFRPGENRGYNPEDMASNTGGENNKGRGGEDYGGGMTNVDTKDSTQTSEQILSLNAFPNPFNLAVTITISLPPDIQLQDVRFGIYNALGQKVKEFSLESHSAKITWNGLNDAGEAVSSGLYFAVLSGPGIRKSVKIVLVK